MEMLVATTVSLALSGMLAHVLGGFMENWNRAEAAIAIERELRAAMHVIRADLEHAISDPGLSSFRLEPNFNGGAIAGMRLDFLSAQSSAQQPEGEPGDVCAIAYFLRWVAGDAERAGAVHLFRCLRPGRSTLEKLPSTDSDEWMAQPDDPACVTEILARRVTCLEVREFGRDDERILPINVEIRLGAISPREAERLRSEEPWTPDALKRRGIREKMVTSAVSVGGPQ